MEAFLAQVAAAAGKASDQGYSKQGRPPVQPKSAAAGRPVKKEGVRQRSPSAPARNRARNSHQEPNTHKHKTLDWQAAPNSAILCNPWSPACKPWWLREGNDLTRGRARRAGPLVPS